MAMQADYGEPGMMDLARQANYDEYGQDTMEQPDMTYDGGQEAYERGPLEGVVEGEEYSSLPTAILNARPKPRLSDEEKLANDCMRRRATDMARRARIFDAKRRMIGCDKDALDAQVAEKAAQKQADYKTAHKDDNIARKIDIELKLVENARHRQKREAEVACKEVSLATLGFDSRSTYDLNDPLAKRKGIPARVGDDDPRCGPSSLQKFSGEDLMKEERTRQQRAAMVSFIEQQKFEKVMMTRRNDDGGGEFAQQCAQITELRNEIEQNEVFLRKELQEKQMEDNMYQAEMNENRRKGLCKMNMDANDRELEFHSTDKFLNEKAPSHFNNRVIRDAYKGSSREERVQVAEEQRQQRVEKSFDNAVGGHDDRQFANTVESTRKQLVAMERDKARQRRALREQQAQDNLALAQEQAANKKHFNKLYTNEFSPDFFEQFGNGCR